MEAEEVGHGEGGGEEGGREGKSRQYCTFMLVLF